MNLRDEFRAITNGWMLVNDWDALTTRIDRTAGWAQVNAPLWPDEKLTVEAMIDCQIATSPEVRRENFRRIYTRAS